MKFVKQMFTKPTSDVVVKNHIEKMKLQIIEYEYSAEYFRSMATLSKQALARYTTYLETGVK